MTIAVLGPGGVGGLVAGALDRAGIPTVVVAREQTAALIAERGLRVSSVRLGDFVAHPRAVARLEEPVEVLVVASKATGLGEALERIAAPPALECVSPPPTPADTTAPPPLERAGARPALVLPLLNGLDHLPLLRERFGEGTVVAGTIRVEADRPEPGVVVHTSPFLRIDMASHDPGMRPAMETLAATLEGVGIPARVRDSEAQVMWGKLVRLNALACTTSAYDKLLGEILSTPELRGELEGAIAEGCAVAAAEGASIDTGDPLGELSAAHPTLGSSMQRDIAAGRTPELDAIPGAVLRAGARHGIPCPTIERLVATIAARAGVPAPVAR
ncbi:MAG TPA: 2-dehydropantoate 2-reductase N-terminal domain-containing protein [Solirubrobacteraceae bacterium]|jgi:2-dehydropantoate 2-reductase|nr:2-dehydropantoate 2-reductase N-terminal domain-containing protein [Solirubrobacteraceae bacterium]